MARNISTNEMWNCSSEVSVWPSGTTNYNNLTNKPSINWVELSWNKTSDDLELQEKLFETTEWVEEVRVNLTATSWLRSWYALNTSALAVWNIYTVWDTSFVGETWAYSFWLLPVFEWERVEYFAKEGVNPIIYIETDWEITYKWTTWAEHKEDFIADRDFYIWFSSVTTSNWSPYIKVYNRTNVPERISNIEELWLVSTIIDVNDWLFVDSSKFWLWYIKTADFTVWDTIEYELFFSTAYRNMGRFKVYEWDVIYAPFWKTGTNPWVLTDENNVILKKWLKNSFFPLGGLEVEEDWYLYISSMTTADEYASNTLQSMSISVSGPNRIKKYGVEYDYNKLKNIPTIEGLEFTWNWSYNDLHIIWKEYGKLDFERRYYATSSLARGEPLPEPTESASYSSLSLDVEEWDKIIYTIEAKIYPIIFTDDNNIIYEIIPSGERSITEPLTISKKWTIIFQHTHSHDAYIKLWKTEWHMTDEAVKKIIIDNRMSPRIYNPSFDIKKTWLRVLDIWNSFSTDPIVYLSGMIENMWLDVSDMCFARLNRGSGSYKTMYDNYCWLDTTNFSYYSRVFWWEEYEQLVTADTISWPNWQTNNMFKKVMEECEFDLIIIHQVSTYSAEREKRDWNTSAWYLNEVISILKAHNPNAAIWFLQTHASFNNNNDTQERWEGIAQATQFMQDNYWIDFIVPVGTAVENLRLTSYSTEENKHISRDWHHMWDWLCQYTWCLAYYQTLLWTRYGVSIANDTFTKDVSSKTPEVEWSNINVDNTTRPVAIRAALAACANYQKLTDPTDMEWLIPDSNS